MQNFKIKLKTNFLQNHRKDTAHHKILIFSNREYALNSVLFVIHSPKTFCNEARSSLAYALSYLYMTSFLSNSPFTFPEETVMIYQKICNQTSWSLQFFYMRLHEVPSSLFILNQGSTTSAPSCKFYGLCRFYVR